MVKKLLKHEFIYYYRTVGMFFPLVLLIGIITRIFSLLNNGSPISRIALTLSTAMLSISCIVLLVLPTVIAVLRFYKNMYSAEGYLTFTLPVTNAQHIFVKLLVAIVCGFTAFLTVFASLSLAFLNEEFLEAISFLKGWIFYYFEITDLVSYFGIANIVFFIIEFVILIAVWAVTNMLLYYACITLGQTAKKNRILSAFGAYFIYYMASQTVSAVFTVAFTLLAEHGALDGLLDWAALNPNAVTHIFMCVTIAIYAILGVAFWFITLNTMTKKLNLE